jgi:hypothetical protein
VSNIIKHLTDQYQINGMSYNFAVMLGFYGMNVEYPLRSVLTKHWAHYAQQGLPQAPIISLDFDLPTLFDEGFKKDIPFMYINLLGYQDDQTKGTIPLIIKTKDDQPVTYTISCELYGWWSHHGIDDGWVSVVPNTTTIYSSHVENYTRDDEIDLSSWNPINQIPIPDHKPIYVWCRVKLLDPTTQTVIIKNKMRIYGAYSGNFKEDVQGWSVNPAKKRVVFDEIFRVGAWSSVSYKLDTGSRKIVSAVVKWVMPEESRKYIKFVRTKEDGSGIDDEQTVLVQALHMVGDATIGVWVYRKTYETDQLYLECKVHIMSDQIEYDAQVIEAPYIGSSLSTPQLYVTTNIGYRVFKNSMEKRDKLDTVQVCAVLQNTFSAGMYMHGGGDFPILLNDCDMANLQFQLVDANYHPVKLLSPMYIIIKVEPQDDPAQDITPFKGRLPLNVAKQLIPYNPQPFIPFYQKVIQPISSYPPIPLPPAAQEAWITTTGIL